MEVLSGSRKRFCCKQPELFYLDCWHLHQGNAPIYNAILVINYLTEMSTKTVPYSPKRPNLAPIDFWLFYKLKENFRITHFEDIAEMKEAIVRILDIFTQKDFKGSFIQECYNKCIEVRGPIIRLLLKKLQNFWNASHTMQISKFTNTVFFPSMFDFCLFIFMILNH